MKYQVRLTAKAEQDVNHILAWFVEQKAISAGQRWFGQLTANVTTLETHPERCALAAEATDLGLEIRELLIGKRYGRYRILFQIAGRTVHILRIWHGARDAASRHDL